MIIQCGTSETTGNTTVEQLVQDLETEQWTYLSKYNLGIKDIAFTGDVAMFLDYHYRRNWNEWWNFGAKNTNG